MLRARIEPDLKHHAENIFHELGLSTTQAIILFYRQVVMNHGLPFEVKIQNPATKRALLDVMEKKNLNKYNSLDELREKLK